MILKRFFYLIMQAVQAGLVMFYLLSDQVSGQVSDRTQVPTKIAILFPGNFQEFYPSHFDWEGPIKKIISSFQQKLLAHPRTSDPDWEQLVNLFILRALCLFSLLKKYKIPFDLVAAQSLGHIPALYAIKALTLPETKKMAHRLAKAVSKASDQIHDQFGQIDALTFNEPIFLRQNIPGVFLIHQISTNTSVYAGTKRALQFLIKRFSPLPPKFSKLSSDCLPISSPFFFPSLPYIHQILQKASYHSPKRILLSDVTGKILNYGIALRLVLYQLWTHPRQTFKMCETLKKQGITHVIILGKDEITEKALKENIPHIKVRSVKQACDIQALATELKSAQSDS